MFCCVYVVLFVNFTIAREQYLFRNDYILFLFFRRLFSPYRGLRFQAQYRVLSDPNLPSVFPDRHYFLGVFLAESRGHPSKSCHRFVFTFHFSGAYSRLTAGFVFKRNIGFYLIQIYLPSSLIVVISWVSFWLNREATQARVCIGNSLISNLSSEMYTLHLAAPRRRCTQRGNADCLAALDDAFLQ